MQEVDTTHVEVAIVEKAIGVKSEKWKGRCHEIASKILNAGLVEGKLRYGHWVGPVHPKSMFANSPVDFVHHGWIERADGTIVDPTRFEFENAKPYVYVGKNDYYDAGGNLFREANQKPAPDWNPYEPVSKLVVLKDNSANVSKFIKGNVNCRSSEGYIVLQIKQAFWLANLSLKTLGESAKDVYLALIEAGQGAFIPIDNRHIVLGGEGDAE